MTTGTDKMKALPVLLRATVIGPRCSKIRLLHGGSTKGHGDKCVRHAFHDFRGGSDAGSGKNWLCRQCHGWPSQCWPAPHETLRSPGT